MINKSDTRKHFSSKRIFTLIELLVVIAIISILASMLLPALQQARARGQMTKCINNQSQITRAFLMYTDDYGGYCPTPTNEGNNSKTILGSQGHTYLIANYLNSVNEGVNHIGFYQYGKRSRFMCPAAQIPNHRDYGGTLGVNILFARSYLSTYNDGVTGWKTSLFRYPSASLCLSDTEGAVEVVYYYYSQAYSYLYPYRHPNQQTVAGMLDGHVASIRRENFVHETSGYPGYKSNARNTYFWRPQYKSDRVLVSLK